MEKQELRKIKDKAELNKYRLEGSKLYFYFQFISGIAPLMTAGIVLFITINGNFFENQSKINELENKIVNYENKILEIKNDSLKRISFIYKSDIENQIVISNELKREIETTKLQLTDYKKSLKELSDYILEKYFKEFYTTGITVTVKGYANLLIPNVNIPAEDICKNRKIKYSEDKFSKISKDSSYFDFSKKSLMVNFTILGDNEIMPIIVTIYKNDDLVLVKHYEPKPLKCGCKNNFELSLPNLKRGTYKIKYGCFVRRDFSSTIATFYRNELYIDI